MHILFPFERDRNPSTKHEAGIANVGKLLSTLMYPGTLTCVGYDATQERLLEQEVLSACGLSWAAWGMAAAWPDPAKRQPW